MQINRTPWHFDHIFPLPVSVQGADDQKWQEVLLQYVRPVSKGATLTLEGAPWDAMICVVDGWLSLSKSLDTGHVQIIDFAMQGDIVGPASADGVTSAVTVEALTDGTAAIIPPAVWHCLQTQLPGLASLVQATEAAIRARRAERALRLGKGSAEMRVAHALLEFGVRLNAPFGQVYHIPMTQQTLGDFLGLSSVHICRTTRRLARSGILEVTDHMDIRVLQPAELAKIAGTDPEALRREILPMQT